MSIQTLIQSDFAYSIDHCDDSITIWKGPSGSKPDGKPTDDAFSIKLNYWEALLLLNILSRNYPQ